MEMSNNSGTFTTVDFPPPGPNSYFTVLLGINNQGEIVGVEAPSNPGWFLLSQGTFNVIGPPGTRSAFSVGQIASINDRGDVVAGSYDNSSHR